jgi:colicin import membrane protein
MSTIPDSRTTPKARTPRTRTPRKDRASFDYGYRYVRETLPDGGERWERKPLTLDDVLHPQEGDVHVLSDPHSADCIYLRVVAEARYADDASIVVFSDCGIFWDIPGLRHHSPDFALIFGVKQRQDWRTFDVATEKVRPSLIIEVTSPKTRVTDLEDKVVEYARAHVPFYVIADAREGPDRNPRRRRLELVAYRLKGKTYQRVRADQQGRVRLEPLNLLLGVRVDPRTGGDRLVLIDPATDQEIGDYAAVDQARAQAEAEARAQAERAEAEARARAAAEARIRELEAQLKGRKRRK